MQSVIHLQSDLNILFLSWAAVAHCLSGEREGLHSEHYVKVSSNKILNQKASKATTPLYGCV